QKLHDGPVRQTTYDPRGRILTASADGTVKLWRNTPGNVLQESAVARGSWGEARTLAINTAGNWVAAGYADGQVRLWELAEPPQRTFAQSWQNDQRMEFVRSGRVLANSAYLQDFSTGWNAPVKKWDLEAIGALAFHPDGRRFAYGD